MIIEGAHLFSENQVIEGNSVKSTKALDLLGKNGNAYINPFLSIRLTKGFTAGSISKIAIQVSDNADMSGAETAIEYFISSSVNQTYPAVLVQETLPRNLKKYCQLVYTGTAMAGGTVFASIVSGVPTNGSV